MTIANMGEWGKGVVARIPSHVLVVSILMLSSTASFMLGMLAGRGQAPVPLTLPSGGEVRVLDGAGQQVAPSALPAAAAAPLYGAPGQGFVASKNGTKYYLPSCGGAGRIKEENKVWFASKADAEASGYTPAANCPGL